MPGRFFPQTAIDSLGIPQSCFTPEQFGAKGDGTTDDRNAIQAAIQAASVSGGTVWFAAKNYLLTSTTTTSGVIYHLYVGADNVELVGAPGAKLLSTTTSAAIFLISGALRSGVSSFGTKGIAAGTTYTMTAAAQFDTQVTVATAAQAGNFVAGDYILVRTGQTIAGTLQPDAEINKVVSVSVGTGIIQLAWPLTKAYVQEYYISGTSGPTSTSVTANLAPFGVANVTDRVISNIAIRNLSFDATGGRHAIVGGSIVGYAIEGCRADITGAGLQSQGATRFTYYRNNRLNCRGTGTSIYHLTTDACSSDCVIDGNMLTGERVVFVHVHEGSANVTITNNTIDSKASVADENAISIRGRAYNIIVVGNRICNGGANGAIYVDATCTGGGLIANNIVSNPTGGGIAVAAPNWTVADNHLINNSDMSIYDKSYSPVVRLTGVVRFDTQTPTIGTLPAYAYVLNAYITVVTAFDSSGTDLLRVGYSGTTNAFATDTDVSTTGSKTVTLGANVGYQATTRDVLCTYAAGGTAPTVGKASVVIEYVIAQRVT